MQSDSQREVLALKLGQGATRDQPRGERKQDLTGRGADNSQKPRQKQPYTERSATETEKHQKNAQAEAPDRNTKSPERRSPKGSKKHTKDKERQIEHHPSWTARKGLAITGGHEKQNPRAKQKKQTNRKSGRRRKKRKNRCV